MRVVVSLIAGLVLFGAVPAYAAGELELLLAQVAALQSQLATLQEKSAVLPGVRVCAAPQRTLGRDDTGEDVANLQIFLAHDKAIYPEGAVTGYFGSATEHAVQRWQAQQKIVSSGTPGSTGYGLVGSRTRSALQQMWSCGGTVGAGWFSASSRDGVVIFSAQASSSVPLDTWPYIETGDGKTERVEVSNVVCKTLAGPCSSVLSARHQYVAPGTYMARLVRPSSQTACISALGPSSCSLSRDVQVLGVTTVTSTGSAAPAAANNLSTTVNGQSQQVTMPPSIRILAPATGVAVSIGGSLTISWAAAYAPTNATVSLSLKKSGTSLGSLVRGQKNIGSFWWALPAPPGAACTADVFTCLTQLATPVCTGDVCAVPTGSYTIVAQLMSGNTAIASAESVPFTVINIPTVSMTTLLPTTTASAATNASGSTSSQANLGAVPGLNSTPAPSASCLYSGIPYSNGITLQVSCTDLAGVSCGSFGMLSLTCRNGTWVDGSGNTTNVPGITTSTSTGASCTTPWGGQKVLSGQQITYEPFFTGGQYTGNAVVPLMQCTQGKWQKCAWDGTACAPYSTVP